MKTRLELTLVLCALAGLPALSLAAAPQQPAAKTALAKPAAKAAKPSKFKTMLPQMLLKDGDTMVFLGDSITHQCLYTQYVEDYYYTRFPNLHIHFHNAGVGGDRASDALARLDDDVLAFKPSYVTILLGMNDGGYRDFDKPARSRPTSRDMTAVLDRLAAMGPPPFP